jgi:hypothetical protein
MTKKEQTILEDFAAFIAFAIEKKLKYDQVIFTLGHDISGLNNKDNKFFLPRTRGYCKRCVICKDPIYGLIQVHHHNEKCKKCGYEIIATQPHTCKKK